MLAAASVPAGGRRRSWRGEKGSYFGIEVADGGPVKADEDSFQDWAWARGWCSTGSPPGCGAS